MRFMRLTALGAALMGLACASAPPMVEPPAPNAEVVAPSAEPAEPAPIATTKLALPPAHAAVLVCHVHATPRPHDDAVAHTLIVLHGEAGRASAELDAMTRLVSAEQRVVVCGHRYLGSSGADDDWRAELAAADAALDAVRTALGAERIHAVGHDLGAVIAMHYAAGRADAVLTLALVGPLGPVDAEGRGFDGGGYDLSELLASVQQPVIIVWGAQDPFASAAVPALVEAFTGTLARGIELKGCGHMPWSECPDAFFKVMDGYYSSVRAAYKRIGGANER